MVARQAGWVGSAALLAAVALPTGAQDRSTDNAVTQADDAFGYSVGRESIGVYSANNTRGFSPGQAGNIRLEGLYYDDIADPSAALIASIGIKVGLAAQGYPFAAPSGIVDIALRRPAARRGASVVVNTDSFGTVGVEVDGSLPLTPRLSLGYGLTGGATQYPDGTSNFNHGQALIARWRPTDRIEIVPFVSLSNDYDDEGGTYLVPAGRYLPPSPPYHRYDGPGWADNRNTGATQGLLTTVTPSASWTIRAGVFRSVFDQRAGFTNLLVDLQPDGSGERLVEADPRALSRSLSGEVRVAHSIADGPRLHQIQLSVRGRDTRREFGGTDEIDLGPGRLGQPIDPPRPAFRFGPVSSDHVTQSNIGLSYDGRWKGVGEIGISIGHSNYRDDVALAGVAPALTRAQPWIGDATLAVEITRRLVAYAGYARGLEQSGVAPSTATNRNQPLGAILTNQREAGLRWAVAGDIKLIAGAFDLHRPYFGFDAGGAYARIGTTTSRGAELSVNGHLTKQLTVVAGGYVLDPRVEQDVAGGSASGAGAIGARAIGARPVGLPSHYAAVNLNWQTPAKGVALDLTVSHRGHAPATIDDAVYLPPHLEIEPGARYAFKLGGHNATARVQVSNLLDDRYFGLNGAGVYAPQSRRYASGYLAVDL